MVRTLLVSLLLVASPSPFTLVNGTGATLDALEIRSAAGSGPWQGLPPGRLSPGARSGVGAREGEICAFDIRGTAQGQQLVWPGVNLCDVKVVTLNRRADGTLWVDYD